MSDVSVRTKDPHKKDPDEMMIMDLTMIWSTIWHASVSNETKIDMHITIKEAIELYNHLKHELENQVVSPSVDR